MRKCLHCEKTFDLTVPEEWGRFHQHMVEIGEMDPSEFGEDGEKAKRLMIEVRRYDGGTAAVTLFDQEGSLLLMGIERSVADELVLLLKRHIPYVTED